MAIPGYQTIPGDGLPSITGAGAMMTITAGNGYLVIIGLLHGLAGGMVAVIMAGHLCNRASVLPYHLAAVTAFPTITGFAHLRDI